jgi:apolipoprotein N-acyltransferase
MNNLSNLSWAFLTLLAGMLLTLSFAPLSYSYLALLSLALLFYSWLDCTPLQAAIRGYCFGLGMFSLGVTWVFVSIYFYGHASVFASALLSESFAAFWALFPALAGYLSVRLSHLTHQRFLLGLTPLIWILIEYVRGYWLLNGFPWLQVAYSQIDSPYAGFMPLFGVYGTGFLYAFTAAAFSDMLYFKRQYLLLSTTVILLILSGCLLKHIEWTTKAGAPIQATLVQGNISQDEKWQEDRLLKTLLTYQQMTYSHWDSQVIVWPETSIPTYLSRVDEAFLIPLERQAIAHHTDLIVSLLEKNNETGAVFNSALVLGKKRGLYRKNHLLPFGEYMPLKPLSTWVLDNIGIRLDDFTPGGDNQPLLTAAGYPFITSICYEDAFGSEAINQISQAAYLVNLSNDGWFGRSFEPYQHLQMARMRAIETGRYLLRSTNTGATAIIAPNGKIIKQAPLFETVSITGTIFPMSGATPYSRLGDKNIIIFLTLLLMTLLGISRRKQIILLLRGGSGLS